MMICTKRENPLITRRIAEAGADCFSKPTHTSTTALGRWSVDSRILRLDNHLGFRVQGSVIVA